MISLRASCVVASLFCGAVAAQAEDPISLGAIGDSISSGFDAKRVGDNRELSWTTGSKPESDSHLKKIAIFYNRRVTGHNEAVAGSTVADLDSQITRVLTYAPDFLTITIGANDVCSWNADDTTQLAAFQAKLIEQIQRIVDARPQIRVYLAAIPDMFNLWELGVQRSGCQSRWNLFNICPALLARARSPLERAAFVERWEDANDALAKVASAFPQNVFHDPSMATTQFEWQHVSTIDCFHPSVLGQNLLSEKTWEAGTFQ